MRAWFKRSAVGRFFFDTYLSNEVREEMNALLSLSRKDPWKESLNDSEERVLRILRTAQQ